MQACRIEPLCHLSQEYTVSRQLPTKKMGALLAVMFDRLIGLVALVTITASLIALRYDFLSKTPETKQLGKRFGTAVHIRRTARGGRLEISFKSDEDLARLIDLLNQ